MSVLQWQDIVKEHPYDAGRLVARGHEWWMEGTPFEEADNVGLVGEKRDEFLRGWNEEILEQAQERKAQAVKELEQLLEAADTGWDPAAK